MSIQRVIDQGFVGSWFLDTGAAFDRRARNPERLDLLHEVRFGITGHDVETSSGEMPTEVGADIETRIGDDRGGT